MSCRGSLTTDLQRENPEVREQHNHPSDETQISLAKVRLRMKQQASDTRDKPGQIFAQVVAECGSDIRAMLPGQETIVTDFEDSILRSLVAVFGRDITTRGCFYHLTQSTWRRVQDLGLVPFYKESSEFRLFCGMLDGLAFLPLDEVQEGMEHLHSVKPDGPAEVDDLVSYFDRTYVNGHFRQRAGQGLTLNMRSVPPMFPPVVWNINEATLNNVPSTNNSFSTL